MNLKKKFYFCGLFLPSWIRIRIRIRIRNPVCNYMISNFPKCSVTILDLQWSDIVEEKEIIRNFAFQYMIATYIFSYEQRRWMRQIRSFAQYFIFAGSLTSFEQKRMNEQCRLSYDLGPRPPRPRDLAEWLERPTANAVVVTVLGSIPAFPTHWNLRGGRWSSVEYRT